MKILFATEGQSKEFLYVFVGYVGVDNYFLR